MGHDRLTRATFSMAHTSYVPSSGPSTRAGYEKVQNSGKLDPLVDPAGYDVIRRSLIRFEERPDGLFVVTVGLPVPVETRLDSTGSMGDNVDKAVKVLPDSYELTSYMLPGADPQMSIGIFGDCVDRFVLCRAQFEMTAPKLVQQLTLMFPEGNGGGNGGEDPQYGLFGGAYLTDAYINRIGLKGYDFTITDEPARDYLSRDQLIRVFGESVFEKAAQNGFTIDPKALPSTKQVITDLQKRAHTFVILVKRRSWRGDGGDYASDTLRFWPSVIDPSRIIRIPRVELLPQVQASIIGLTEGTLSLQELEGFLKEHEVTGSDAQEIIRSVANIPIGAQTTLPNFGKGPKVGDVFREKTDLWPMDPSEVPALEDATDDEPDPEEGPGWL